MAIDDAIKELVSEALAQVKEEQEKTAERCAALEQKVGELSAQLEEKTKETQDLRGDLEQKAATIEALDGRLKALEAFDSPGLLVRVDRLEDNPDGLGGLKQALEKVAALDAGSNERQEKLEASVAEHAQIARAAKTRTDEFETELRQHASQSTSAEGKIKDFHRRLEAVEATSSQVRDRQQKVEDIEAGLESTLRNEILSQLESFKDNQLLALQSEFESSRHVSQVQTKSLVNGALELLSKARAERSRLSVKRDLLLGWREQAWISARRKMGLVLLHRFSQRRSCKAVTHWARVAAKEAMSGSLRQEFRSEISSESASLRTELERPLGLLSERCSQLDGHVESLGREKAVASSVSSSMDRVSSLLADQQQQLSAVVEREASLRRETEEQLGTQKGVQDEIVAKVAELTDPSDGLAKKHEVQCMVRDLVLIWNSVKQLDTAKCCKAEMDAVMLEATNRQKELLRRLEELEKATSSRGDEKHGLSQRMEEVSSRLEESRGQLRHWEGMWDRLAGFVEDLVQKVGDLQTEAGTAKPASASASTLPASPGWPPAKDRVPPSSSGSFLNHKPLKIPNLTDADTTAPPSDQSSQETKKLWTGSSKNLMQPQSRLPRPGSGRPSSASARRSVDRMSR